MQPPRFPSCVFPQRSVCSGRMRRALEQMAMVAGATVGSRLLGLLRDVLLFAMLGAGAVNSAFLLAFTLPNLFRRLLGEGALTSAMVPVLAGEAESAGRASVFLLFNQVITRLLLVLGGIAGGGMLLLALLRVLVEWSPRYALALELGILLLPYLIFVCLAAAVSSALHVLDRFGVASLSQIWLNLSMIASLGIGATPWVGSAEERVLWLCGGVLVGGVAQVLAPAIAMAKEGWRPALVWGERARLQPLMTLLIPGLLGAAVVQVNIMVSRLIAFWFSPDAVSILYLANRLVELPLGVFVIAVTTVCFPAIARYAARGQLVPFVEEYQHAQRLILAISLPAGIGLILLGGPILELLFAYGAFSSGDVAKTVVPLAIYAAGLPLYAMATLATRGLHARRDMRSPVRIAVINLFLNIVLSLALLFPLGIAGLAIANVVASGVQWWMLSRALRRHTESRLPHLPWRALGVITTASLGMILLLLMGRWGLSPWMSPGKAEAALLVGVLIPMAILLYAALLWFLRFEDRQALRDLLFRRTP